MKARIKLTFIFLLVYMAAVLFFWPFSEGSAVSGNKKIDKNLPRETGGNYNSSEALVTEELIEPGKSSRSYSWNYEGYRWHLTLLLDDKLYSAYESRTRKRDYDLFASDPYDDWLIKNIADTLVSLSNEYGLEEKKIPGLCVSFIQSLNYTSDLTSSGYDQYPRFPYETLFDNGGDCEDTSILSVAILQEMGYDVVLLELPEHMALGIKCSPETRGRSFEYNNNHYYYLETTGSNWEIGEMPEEYKDEPVEVIPVYRRPLVNLDFSAQCEYSQKEGVVDVNVTLRNVGSEVAENTTVYVALQAEDGSKIWDQIESDPVIIEPEGAYQFTAKGLRVPGGRTFRVYVRALGENLFSEEITSEWVSI
ncbi:hypothetical protein [Methanosarcina mazei]|uniref:CARDB domain-containing protein n=1 Tax=Methanosarcina mazei TaxID=2209 RepID=A0A0F8PU98_METMZ|nr:hypothetical protein [Methanosarcina mazei]KKH66153.1 hypothetical protein DU87_12135 [Methanosarcina mazei]UWJ21880.1 hypothetical protein MSMAT_0623 [Methanosarcina mazei TMA]BBL66660.1 hypothetical protein MmazTMA_36370 [Methanosarcina mazei]